MKKLFFVALFLGSASMSFAQLSQGTISVGGTIGYTTTSPSGTDAKGDDLTTESKASSFEIQPTVGYFVADNIAIGLGIGYQMDKSYFDADTETDKNETTSNLSWINVSPFGRYYASLGDQFAFFAELRVDLAFGSLSGEAAGVEFKDTPSISKLGVSLNPGFVFFPTESIGIELGLTGISYQSVSSKSNLSGDDSSSKVNSFTILSPRTTGITADPNNPGLLTASPNTGGAFAGLFAPKLGIQFYF